jgi:hypothetical protein
MEKVPSGFETGAGSSTRHASWRYTFAHCLAVGARLEPACGRKAGKSRNPRRQSPRQMGTNRQSRDESAVSDSTQGCGAPRVTATCGLASTRHLAPTESSGRYGGWV